MEVAEPNCLHNIGMAWDGEHLWVGHEPAETGETGRVYELAVRNGSLSVVASFAHPTSAPDALAWDGSGIWSTGHEGPDPLRPWEAGLSHVYRHDRAAGLSVTGRYSTDTQIGCGAGLTWDGVSLWGSGGNNICRFVQTADGLQIADRHAGPDNQLRSIEWVQSYLWALDSASNRLYKLDPAAGFAVVCSCAPGVQGSYGMAWDGAGFWLDSMGQPSLRRYLPGKECPAP
jgi:glutamine cyclotransferase